MGTKYTPYHTRLRKTVRGLAQKFPRVVLRIFPGKTPDTSFVGIKFGDNGEKMGAWELNWERSSIQYNGPQGAPHFDQALASLLPKPKVAAALPKYGDAFRPVPASCSRHGHGKSKKRHMTVSAYAETMFTGRDTSAERLRMPNQGRAFARHNPSLKTLEALAELCS